MARSFKMLPAIWLEQLDEPLPVILTVFSLAKSWRIDLNNLCAFVASRSLTIAEDDDPLISSRSSLKLPLVSDLDERHTLKFEKYSFS